MPHVSVFQADGLVRTHGGVAAYITHDLAANAEFTDAFANGTTETLALKIRMLNFLLITVYRPLNSFLFSELTEELNNILAMLQASDTEPLLTGDSNLSHIHGPFLSIQGRNNAEKRQAQDLVNITD